MSSLASVLMEAATCAPLSRDVAELELVRHTYRMSIESDFVERVNRAASKKQIPISDTKQK